jgi:mono/diheme cytochrome c family protein
MEKLLTRLSGIGAALAVFAAAPAAVAQGDVEQGRKFAEKHCSRCHVVGDYNPTGGISSTPSFQLLVKRRPDYQYRFQTFFERHPHPAFLSLKGEEREMEHLPPNAAPVEITCQDIENLAAFVEKLKKREEAEQDDDKPVVFSPRPKPRMR